MIREVSSDRPTFKALRFRKGLNIILAQKSPGSNQKDKRNAVGKSSFLDVVHFMLGGDRDRSSTLSAPELKDDSFRISFDLSGVPVEVQRSIKDHGRLLVLSNTFDWPIQPDVNKDAGEVTITLEAWRDLLGRTLIGLPPKSQVPNGSFLSFRSCISYFARRQKGDGYSDWRRNNNMQRPADWQVNLSFLLGLDWRAPLAIHRVKEREAAKRELRRALRENLLGLSIQSLSALRPRYRKLKMKVDKLEDQLSGFRVIDAYEELESTANELQAEIDDLANANVLDRGLLTDISRALEIEDAPEPPELERLYLEAGVVLPKVSLARYDDVKKFHEAIISNRRLHLEAERKDATERIERRKGELTKLSARRNQLLESLNTGGALSHYRQLDRDLSQRRTELESVSAQVELAEKFDALNADLKVERAEAERKLKADVHERAAILDEAAEVFEEISARLYAEAASIAFMVNQHGLDIVIERSDIGSVGVRRAQIFTFDLTLATVCARRGRWPGFLIHDSHIFDGLDGRQTSSALFAGHERTLELDGQYIVTMNSDDLEKAEREGGRSFQEFIISPTLDDSKNGGLFGFRFDSPKAPEEDRAQE